MRFVIAGDTRDGSLMIFWPELLPADFEERFEVDAGAAIVALEDSGKLIWFDCEKTGEHLLGLFVDELPLDALQSCCLLTRKIDALTVAEVGWFAGLEWIFRDDRAAPKDRRRKCGEVRIPAGVYSAEVFRTSVPADVFEHWLRDQAGESAQRWWWVQTWFAATGVVAAIALVAAMFVGTREFVIGAAIVSGVLLAIASLMSLTPGYQRIQQARREYSAAYPDFVVCLRTIATNAAPRPDAE